MKLRGGIIRPITSLDAFFTNTSSTAEIVSTKRFELAVPTKAMQIVPRRKLTRISDRLCLVLNVFCLVKAVDSQASDNHPSIRQSGQ